MGTGGKHPGYAAKVMVEQIDGNEVCFSSDAPDFLDYLRTNGDCYVCFVSPIAGDPVGETSAPESPAA